MHAWLFVLAVSALPTATPNAIGNISPAALAWFGQWRCADFHGYGGGPHPKRADGGEITGDDHLNLGDRVNAGGVAYDAVHHLAVLDVRDDLGESYEVRRMYLAPPAGVKHADLSTVRLKSGVRIGTTAAAAARLLGKPDVVEVCGQQLYLYDLQKDHAFLRIGVKNGRVISIWLEGQD